MSEELDDIGRETAAVMKTMLQLATLVALRTRERGQKEAEARAKLTEARMKEAKELQIREARESKAKDPRNLELARMVEKSTSVKGISLEKDRSGGAMSTAGSAMASGGLAAAATGAAGSPMVKYDSPERRMAIAAHLAKMGVAPELAAVRMLMEVGQGLPAEEAVRARTAEARSTSRSREIEGRGLERTRN
ncbi:hypothetical protein IU443_11230 [Nocardia farcinica]|uniref:Uncharacterized protein n=4 Tax=Nocardia farcinica TaxID=37329 RepID=Q5YTH7_NOCFA|nr:MULTISPECIES: hypothetical protein [Nocardia]AXK88964.1 hypothetical protein DXT66_28045 [Nocardia farcinica]MBA4859306.1 hypothetical protein [Nocardia farcinica]MBC9816473.1 hypothetical protein [Nocardia farcinica]MBF6139497.1 hypothetical protein [Nocardia farcinica]MBF6185749.1 hypothetical protein [Nocardia farcinica]